MTDSILSRRGASSGLVNVCAALSAAHSGQHDEMILTAWETPSSFLIFSPSAAARAFIA
jgi:hypothetical protein